MKTKIVFRKNIKKANIDRAKNSIKKLDNSINNYLVLQREVRI